MDLTLQHRNAGDLEGADAGGIVLGWVTKLVVVAAIIGTLGFDGISVGLGHLSTTDDAAGAAQAASQSYQATHSLLAAYNAAVATVNAHEEVLVAGFGVKPDGTATVTVTNTVHTLVLFRTSRTKDLAVITEHATGKYTGS